MLEGGVKKYVWVTNGGCDDCQALDGQEFDSIDDIPDKPHPGCQCSIQEVEDEPCDCLELLDELSELVGDANCLQEELANMMSEVGNLYEGFAQSLLDEMETWDNAIGDFARNYNDMVEANTIGADKYFHSKANCEAAQRGFGGEVVSGALSIYRELEEGTRKVIFEGKDLMEQVEDAKKDLKANDDGREQGKKYPDKDPRDLIKKYRPKGLDDKY